MLPGRLPRPAAGAAHGRGGRDGAARAAARWLSRYALTNHARCGICGDRSRGQSSEPRVLLRLFGAPKRGTRICPNTVVVRVERVDDAVRKAIGGDVRRLAVVSAILDGVLEQLLRRTWTRLATATPRPRHAHGQPDGHRAGPPCRLSLRGSLNDNASETPWADVSRADTLHQRSRSTARPSKPRATRRWPIGRACSADEDGRQLLRDVVEMSTHLHAGR
jgi:hypothetical protein